MSKMRIVMFGLAIGSAVIAGLLARGTIGGRPEKEVQVVAKPKTIDVLVASKDLQTGEKLAAGTLSWRAWPLDNVQDAMITKEEMPDAEQKFAEARAGVNLYQGEVMIEKKIVILGSGGFMSAILPKGMRAISVAIAPRASAGGFILPNDRVDVILTKKIPGPGQLVKSETVISNVRVLAMNQIFRKVQEGDEVALKEIETTTLELTSPQAEVLAKVETEGELSLALRSIAENDGAALDEGPMLADKYRGSGTTRASDTLFIRAGIETYGTNR